MNRAPRKRTRGLSAAHGAHKRFLAPPPRPSPVTHPHPQLPPARRLVLEPHGKAPAHAGKVLENAPARSAWFELAPPLR
jgi:hypothetical protein